MIVNCLEDKKIVEAAQILMDYHLNMEQFKENIMGLMVGNMKVALYDDLEASTKAAFTREFTKMNNNSIKNQRKVISANAGIDSFQEGPVQRQREFKDLFSNSKFDPDIQDQVSDPLCTDSEDEDAVTPVKINKQEALE